jgi:hypothetical protein
MKRTLLALLALALAACTPTEAPPPSDAVQDQVAELWTAETRAVLTGDAARTFTHQCSRVSPGPVEDLWTPSEAEISAMDALLILELSRQLEAAGQSPSPGDYHRQIAGFVIGGKRVIYVNGVQEQALALSSDSTFDWRTQAVQICDGGTITFGVEYDPATQQFANFAFNGAL